MLHGFAQRNVCWELGATSSGPGDTMSRFRLCTQRIADRDKFIIVARSTSITELRYGDGPGQAASLFRAAAAQSVRCGGGCVSCLCCGGQSTIPTAPHAPVNWRRRRDTPVQNGMTCRQCPHHRHELRSVDNTRLERERGR